MKTKHDNKSIKKPKGKQSKVQSGKQTKLPDPNDNFFPFSKAQQIGKKSK